MKKILSILKRNSLILALVLVMGIMGLGFYLIHKMQKDISKLEDSIKTQYEEVKKYETKKEEAPSPELINRLTKQQGDLQSLFNSLLMRFSTTYPRIPEFKVFPNVEYKEFLLETEDFLIKKARKNNVTLPTSLGFSETGFPRQEEIPMFCLQLTVLKSLLDLLIDAGVSVVNSVVPGAPSSVAFYRILPLNISITGNSIEIVRFLKYLNNPSSFFTLESFQISKTGPDVFKADFKINAVMLKKEGTEETGSVVAPPANQAPAPAGKPQVSQMPQVSPGRMPSPRGKPR